MIAAAANMTPDEIEDLFRESSIDVPPGYTGSGIAWSHGGPVLYVTGPGVPAMKWMPPGRWVRVVEPEVPTA